MRSISILVLVVVCVMAVTNIASATTVRGIEMEFVTIGNAGNVGDIRTEANPYGCGAVDYEYQIGKYEITNEQWNAFVDAAGVPTGTDGGYDRSAYWIGEQQPTNVLSWFEAAQFCNYLTTGDKSQGVYQFSGDNDNPGDFLSILDHENAGTIYGAAYFLPTEDEWYKAAYYTGSGYSTYANGTNIAPIAGVETNYDQVLPPDGPWDIGTGIIEQNGTFDMMGNVWEWNEAITATSGFSRGVRGGSYRHYDYHLASSYRGDATPGTQNGSTGFRVACIILTEPPIADAGLNQTATDTDDNGSEDVTLDGSGSSDSDGTIVSWEWADNLGDTIPNVVSPTASLSIGIHIITLTVTDDDGLTDTDTVTVTVRPHSVLQAGAMVGWGLDHAGQATPPEGNDHVAIAGGAYHSIALKSDGSIAGWGLNDFGQATPPAGNDYVAIAAGTHHNIALKNDGSLFGWGRDHVGQISNTPSGNDYVAIAAGGYYCIALKNDGSIVGWGVDSSGQASPPAGDYVAISAGGAHGIALKSDGSIVGWGNNKYGQLNNPPLGNDYVAIAAGGYHGIALKNDGSIVGWGWNNYGQCDVPVGNDFIAVAAGYYYSIALKSDGSIISWGADGQGQISNTPIGTDFVVIAAGRYHSLAIVVELNPPDANANGPYTVFVGDTLTLDANGSTDADDDIVSFMWDLDDDGVFETDAGGQAVYDVNYAYLESLELLINHTYTIHLKVTDSDGQSDTADSTLTIVPKPAVKVAVDIKPGGCPNPVNVKSSGVLPVAILGSVDVNVYDIDPTSIRLAGVESLRSGYEDVATPIFDANDCNCIEAGPDGLIDLTLKFETQAIVKAIGDVNHGDILELELTGILYDPVPYETPIEGQDCILIKGRHRARNRADINKDGVVDSVDFAILGVNWLQSTED
ncbi:SUMF1/EgtB/PvdO family nonheme iron enzyme [Planctomycetota bacterium]